MELTVDLGGELRRALKEDGGEVLVRLPVRIHVILKRCIVILIVDRYMVMYPDLIISNIQQFTSKIKLVNFMVRLGTNRIIIVPLLIVHPRPVAQVLLNKPFVIPAHFDPM